MSKTDSIDIKALRSYIGNNDDDAIEMIELFLQLIPSQMAQMKISLAQKNWHSLNYMAHQIKPSLDVLGFQTAKEKAGTIEKLTKTGEDTELIKKYVDELSKLLDTICEDLTNVGDKLKNGHYKG